MHDSGDQTEESRERDLRPPPPDANAEGVLGIKRSLRRRVRGIFRGRRSQRPTGQPAAGHHQGICRLQQGRRRDCRGRHRLQPRRAPLRFSRGSLLRAPEAVCRGARAADRCQRPSQGALGRPEPRAEDPPRHPALRPHLEIEAAGTAPEDLLHLHEQSGGRL